jgi:adenylate cyclase
MNVLLAGSTWQRLRLASGLILFAFAATHFLNHALGLVSLEAMEAFQDVRKAVTRSLPGSAVLIGALAIHVGLALWRIAHRATARMPAWEAFQILTGIAIPLLLIPHIVGTRIAWTIFGVEDDYGYTLLQLWPYYAIEQSALLVLVWVHGSIGMHFWLRLSSWYARWQPVLLALAVALPILALAGFTVAGREVADIALDEEGLAEIRATSNWPSEEAVASLIQTIGWLRITFAALLAAAGLSLVWRVFGEAIRRRLKVIYAAGPAVSAPVGPTLLEISRMRGIPHAAVCGGRARCSTCRVRIDEGLDALAPPQGAEQRTLARIQAAPGVRLACQIHPTRDLKVTRLVRAGEMSFRRMLMGRDEQYGAERTLAILFLDVRGFTRLSQSKLPYDVVFILNRLFDIVGREIEAERGWIDKYLGDGLMAVFGRELGPEEGCRQALRAASRIDIALDRANEELSSELGGMRLEIGIGIHVGPMVVGEIGYRDTAAMTVIGRTVNAASRLEALTKEEGCQLIVSADVMRLAGGGASLARKSVAVRGLDEPLDIVLVPRARDLA